MAFRDPWIEISQVQRDIERFIDDFFRRKPPSFQFFPQGWEPPADVYETEEEFVILVELSGVERDDIDIKADATSVAIRGVRRNNFKGVRCHQLEIYWGTFERVINLPSPIDPDSARATFRDGLLEIILPKPQKERTLHLKPRPS